MIETSRIRLLRRDVSVWLVNAGRNRKFLDEFVRTRRVFLEAPGFTGVANLFDDDKLLRMHLARSWAMNEYLRGAASNAPSRNVSAYSAYPFASGTPEARAFGELVGNVIRLFDTAKVGDLVLVPRYGAFAPFLVGEIIAPWSPSDCISIPQLRGEDTATRRVRWLSTAFARTDFSPGIGRRLVNRHAVTEVRREFYQDIFEKVYPNFSWGDISKIDVFGNGYTGKDPTQPFEAALLVKYVLSSVFAYEKGEIDEFNKLSRSSIQSAISRYYDEALVEELAQNFNSPGKFTVVGRIGTLSLLAATGLLLATANPAPFSNQKTSVSQKMGSNLAGTKTQKNDAKAEIDNFLNAAEGNVWTPVQANIGRPAANNMGVSLDNGVELERKMSQFEQ